MMQPKRLAQAMALTLALLIVSVVVENHQSASNSLWHSVNFFLQVPGWLLLQCFPADRGFMQTALPLIFTALCYFLGFWVLLSLCDLVFGNHDHPQTG